MPAAAVTPAPIAYTIAAASKTLVVYSSAPPYLAVSRPCEYVSTLLGRPVYGWSQSPDFSKVYAELLEMHLLVTMRKSEL